MLTLTFTTGMADAIGFLGLDRVFTGNMTGNVVILGMALVGAEGLPVLGPALALVGFMAGAALGGRVLRRAASGWTGRITGLFAAVGLIMVALAIVLFLSDEELGETTGIFVSTLLAAAMGIQAAAARFIAVKDVTTVVVTSTITGLAADSFLGTGKGGGSGRRSLAVVLILAGAAVGAATIQVHLGLGLLIAGVIALGVTIAGAAHARIQLS